MVLFMNEWKVESKTKLEIEEQSRGAGTGDIVPEKLYSLVVLDIPVCSYQEHDLDCSKGLALTTCITS